MEKEKINFELDDIFIHLDFEAEEEKIKSFLTRLSPENLPSIGEIKRKDEEMLFLTIREEKAILAIDKETIHLIAPKIVGTTLEKSNSSLNEVLGLLAESTEGKISINGRLRVAFKTDIKADAITSKFLPESKIREICSKVGSDLKAKGVRCILGEDTDAIFDADEDGNLYITGCREFKKEGDFGNLLKKEIGGIQSLIEPLITKVRGI